MKNNATASKELFFMASGMLSALLAIFCTFVLLPRFGDVVSGFGLRPPLLSRLLLETPALSLVGMAAVLIAWFALKGNKWRGTMCALIGMISLACVVAAAYVPILQMRSG